MKKLTDAERTALVAELSAELSPALSSCEIEYLELQIETLKYSANAYQDTDGSISQYAD